MKLNHAPLRGIQRSIDAACLIVVAKFGFLALEFPGRVFHAETPLGLCRAGKRGRKIFDTYLTFV